MCMYLSSEIVLANLLDCYEQSDDGVDLRLIHNYCQNIKERLAAQTAHSTGYIIFQVDSIDIDKDLQYFPKHFYKFMGRYYKGKNFDSNFFNNRYNLSQQMLQVMQIAAHDL